jgi:signal transduction histidine kinase
VERELTTERREQSGGDRAEERQRLLAEALEAVRVRDEFLSIAAHELRTPLTTIRAQAQLLLRRIAREGSLDPGLAARALQVIDKQSDRLDRLIAQLLDVSRLQGPRLDLDRQEVDLVELVRAVVADTRLRCEGRPIEAWLPERRAASVDPLRLEQVLVNLLDNADKYSPAGAPIDVEMRSGAAIEIAVRDQGPGVPPEQRERIFERFYQAHTRTRSGMGLGLYISRQIVELHGGTLTAEFPTEGGSRFVIRLPEGGA